MAFTRNSLFDSIAALPEGRRDLIDRQTSIDLVNEQELLFVGALIISFCCE
jgi:hypothetical protein